jgi:hypothetical protein
MLPVWEDEKIQKFMHTKVHSENPKRKYLSTEGRIILKWISRI